MPSVNHLSDSSAPLTQGSTAELKVHSGSITCICSAERLSGIESLGCDHTATEWQNLVACPHSSQGPAGST